MSNYYNKQDAKVRIAHELMNRGWKVEGYHADESDSMTDYYSPAYWNGIATKNGFVLVVDNNQDAEAKEITKYNYNKQSSADREKISKLEAMTIERGCTAGEEENAKALIEKIKNKESENVDTYEIIGYTTAHIGNPKGCIWHIEKDGKIYDKGNGLTKFSDMLDEYMFDINKMEFKQGYEREWTGIDELGCRITEERKLTDEQKKVINDFKALILRFERVINNMNGCGDGTTETEEAGKAQQTKEGYEKITKKEIKKVFKMVEVERKTVKIGDYLSFSNRGGFWLITDEKEKTGTWKIDGISTKLTKNTYSYERVGSESRGCKQVKNTDRYYQWEDTLLKEIEAGTTKIFEYKEIEEEVVSEKWEKIDKTKKAYNTTSETKQEEKTEQQEQPTTESIINHEINIIEDIDTRDNSPLWVVKIVDTLSKDEYIKVSEQFKTLKGYYSKFKHGFIFKYNPSEALKGNTNSKQEQKNPYEPEEIKEGYIYDCHFKEYDFTIDQIKNLCDKLSIQYIDMGCKIGFEAITADQATQVKTISDENRSIFFIDRTVEIIDISEQEEQTAEVIIDYSTDIITALNLQNEEYSTNEEYKNKLLSTLKDKQIKINNAVLFYLYKNNYNKLEEVLRGFLKQQEEEQKQQEQQQAEKAKLIEKIDNNIESLQSKINSLSGDYKTNTYKRMNEQASRDSKKESFDIEIKILEYVKQKLIDNETITGMENGLISGAFRTNMHQWYIRKYGIYPSEIKFPEINHSYDKDNWYNKEVPKEKSRLNKYDITNTKELNTAIEQYKIIYDEKIDRSFKNPLQKQIKTLENQYKLSQKGDINFTPAKVVDRLIEYAQIDNNSIVLEPSAGIGNIADKIKAITEKVDCLEYMNHFSELLKLKKHNVTGNDILQYNRLNYYDAVIMNPPFSEETDHIKQAYKTLKAGGKLISITSPSWTFNNNKKSQEFREWFKSVGGEIIEELENGTFEMTQVRTLIIEINKEEETIQEAI